MRVIAVAAALLAASASAFALRASAEQALPMLTAAEKADGWKLMFDGKSLAGWRGYKDEKAPGGWRAFNGDLVRLGGGGDLMTVEEYGDFDMRFEWKITEYGNSGVIYRIATTEPYPWHTGPEYQILDDARHPDGQNRITSAGSNYAVNEPVKNAAKPVGKWNEGRIIAKGNHVEHWLNGVKVVDYEFGSADWQKRVQASKFGKIPPYGTVKRGYIALQDHESVVIYRNLKDQNIMKRRDFLWTLSSAAMLPSIASAQNGGPSTPLRAGGTILYDSRSVALTRVDTDASGALWVRKADLPRINGFEIKPQGACRADICIPIPRGMMKGDTFNLTAFAQRVGQKFIADPSARVWSFGEIPVVQGAYVESRIAPDVTVPDRKGRPVRLSQFRGKKVLLVTWASW